MSKPLCSGARALAMTLLAALAAGAGCAPPPPYVAVNHQAIVPLTPPDVWRRLHAFFQDQNIQVRSEDVAAGLIDAREEQTGKGLLAAYADCGHAAGLLRPLERQVLDLTVRVRPAPDGSQVTVEARFSQTLHDRRAGSVTVACRTRGVLEAAILQVASGQPMEAAVIPR